MNQSIKEWKATWPVAVGTLVRFKEDALIRMSIVERKRLVGRVGKISNYRIGAVAPTVTFAKNGRFAEIKLFEVRVADLDLIASD